MFKLNPTSMMKVTALAAVLGLAGIAAQALPDGAPHGRHGGPGMAGGPRIEQMLEQVDASEAQRSQVKQIMKTAAEDLRPQHEALRKLMAEGQALLTATTIDATAVEALRLRSQAQQEQISKRMSQALVAAANVLTPEQRAKLGERMAKHQARMAEHHAKHQAERAERRKP
jgi:periplasmic protein CpxP/Spy